VILKTFGLHLAKYFLTQIDDTTRGDHTRLGASDTCLYLFEYTSRKRYDFSATNNLISNLKKKPSTSGTYAYRYKGVAIKECIDHLAGALRADWLAIGTLVPIPCSKVVGHPDYDDRVEQICRGIPGSNVKSIVRQTQSTQASHEAGEGDRLTVEDLLSVYDIDESQCTPAPTSIAIVDDVLTGGTHYRAMHTILSGRFSGVPIFGIFIARRVFPDPLDETED
jgi:hypothetical protein